LSGHDRSGDRPLPAVGEQRAVLRNMGVLGLAQVATMLLNLAALVHIARTVGETWFGILQWGVAFSAYALIVAEWGLGLVAVREVARETRPQAVRTYAGTHLGLMLCLGLLVLASGGLLLPVFPMFRADPLIMLVYLATIVPFAVSLDWLGIGLERLGTVSVVKTLRTVLYAAAVLGLLGTVDGLAGWPAARWVPVFFWLAWLAAAVLMAARARAWLGGWVWPRLGPWSEWRRRLAITAPLGAGALTMRVLLNIDVILLGTLAAPAVVGNYAAAAKVVFVLVIAVEVIWKALLPRLSRAWRESADRCRRRFSLYLGVVLVLGLPVATGGALLGGEVMTLLYGERFPEAGAVCRILSVSYVALAIGQFLCNGLIASDRQRRYFPPLLVAAGVAVASVLVLVPRLGGVGAAWGMLTAHLSLAVISGWVGRDLLRPTLVRPVLAATAGCLVLALAVTLAGGWPLLPRLGLGTAVYALVAGALVRGWLRHEIRVTGL
jgi:O-antigen/teichoic acid export membrane protein